MENLEQLYKTIEERSATATFSACDTTPGRSDPLVTTVLNYQREAPLSPLLQTRFFYGIHCFINWSCGKTTEYKKLTTLWTQEGLQVVQGRRLRKGLSSAD